MDYIIKDQFNSDTHDQFFIKYISSSDQEYQKSLNILTLNQKIQQENTNQITSHQDLAINSIHNNFDIVVTPLRDLETFIQANFKMDKQSHNKLIKRIIITKRIMKRQKAKERTSNKMRKQKQQIIQLKNQEMDDQKLTKQKKRNRMSAQSSRDKKKMYMNYLEDANRQLTMERKRYAQQNEELRRRVNKLQQQKNDKSKNKFIKLLIFLGLFFIINLIKQNFLEKSNQVSINNIKVQTQNQNYLKSKELDQIIKNINQNFLLLQPKQSGFTGWLIQKIKKMKERIPQTMFRQILKFELIKKLITQTYAFIC